MNANGDPAKGNQRQLEIMAGRLLRIGVITAATVVGFGAAIYLTRHAGERAQYAAFRGEPSDLRTVSGIAGKALALSGRGVIQLGLLLLIATPVLRVLFCVAAFSLQRDATYSVVTLIVLTFLVYGLFG